MNLLLRQLLEDSNLNIDGLRNMTMVSWMICRFSLLSFGDRHGRNSMVGGFITTYAISA
jgi:hypothetical protein